MGSLIGEQKIHTILIKILGGSLIIGGRKY